jgi:N-acetylglutamate synthase-like GNAT family acetyltransferase
MIEIAYLADHPEHLHMVASWVYQQWGRHRPDNSVELTEERYRSRMQKDAIPLIMIALEEGKPVGTASLTLRDLPSRPDLAPWLAAVFVPAVQRSRGIGSLLVESVEAAARELGVEMLYLFTPDKEHFYARMGWRTLERTEFRAETVVVMSKRLQGDR